MYLRLFVYAEKEDQAQAIYQDCIKDIKNSITEVYKFKCKPYWKISSMYVIESNFQLNIAREKFELFLYSISDYWEDCGAIVPDELLASEKAAECEYIKDDISLVNLFFEEEEYHLIPYWEDGWKQIWLDYLEETKGERQTTEEALGLTKEQVQIMIDRSLEKDKRVEVAMCCMNEGYTFDDVMKELDAGRTVEELYSEVYTD